MNLKIFVLRQFLTLKILVQIFFLLRPLGGAVKGAQKTVFKTFQNKGKCVSIFFIDSIFFRFRIKFCSRMTSHNFCPKNTTDVAPEMEVPKKDTLNQIVRCHSGAEFYSESEKNTIDENFR